MGKGEETRQAVLDEALQVASEVGLNGLTIGNLATHTRMSKSGLFAHFKSKEALQVQVLQHARDRFVEQVIRPTLATKRGEPRLRALFEHWLVWSRSALRGGCIFVSTAAELDDREGPVRDELVRSERDWMETIATVAGTAVSEGQLRSNLDLQQFAYELHGVMLAHYHATRLMRDPAAFKRAHKAFESLLDAARKRR